MPHVREFPLESGDSVALTVSIGIAGLETEALSAEALVARADEALYIAKGQGRNRTRRYAQISPAGERHILRLAEVFPRARTMQSDSSYTPVRSCGSGKGDGRVFWRALEDSNL